MMAEVFHQAQIKILEAEQFIYRHSLPSRPTGPRLSIAEMQPLNLQLENSSSASEKPPIQGPTSASVAQPYITSADLIAQMESEKRTLAVKSPTSPVSGSMVPTQVPHNLAGSLWTGATSMSEHEQTLMYDQSTPWMQQRDGTTWSTRPLMPVTPDERATLSLLARQIVTSHEHGETQLSEKLSELVCE
jgi:hypothetical protein